MRAKRGYHISLVVICILFAGCIFLPVFKLDLSFITVRLADVFGNPELWEDGKSWNVFGIFKELGKLNDDVKGMVTSYSVGIFLPHILNIAILILSFFRRKKTVIASIAVSACNVLCIALIHLVIVPARISAYVENIIDGTMAGKLISWLNPNLSSDAGEQLASVYTHSLSWGFGCSIVLMIGALVISVVELFDMPVDSIKPVVRQERRKTPMLKDICGVYQYAEFPFEGGEPLIIGRSPEMCNIIIQGEKVSRKHCEISFNETTGQYRITDFSTNGTFISGRGKMKNGSSLMIASGTRIGLGERDKYYFQVG